MMGSVSARRRHAFTSAVSGGGVIGQLIVFMRAVQPAQKMSSPSDRLATSASPSRLSRISTGRADGAAAPSSGGNGRSSADNGNGSSRNGAGNGGVDIPVRSSGSFTGGVQQSSNSRTSLRTGSTSSVTSAGSGGGGGLGAGSFTRQHRRSGSRAHSEHRELPEISQLSPAAAQAHLLPRTLTISLSPLPGRSSQGTAWLCATADQPVFGFI